MNLSVTRKRPGTVGVIAMFFAGIRLGILLRIKKWAPMGFQDESGFHLGNEKVPGN